MSIEAKYTIQPGPLSETYIDGEGNPRVSQDFEFQCQVLEGTGIVERGVFFKNVFIDGCAINDAPELFAAYAKQLGLEVSSFQVMHCALLSEIYWRQLEVTSHDCTTTVRATATKRV